MKRRQLQKFRLSMERNKGREKERKREPRGYTVVVES
jgi:hypothetical protein